MAWHLTVGIELERACLRCKLVHSWGRWKKSNTMQNPRKFMHGKMKPFNSPIVRQIVYVQGTHFTPTVVQYPSITLISLFEANDACTMSQNRNTSLFLNIRQKLKNHHGSCFVQGGGRRGLVAIFFFRQKTQGRLRNYRHRQHSCQLHLLTKREFSTSPLADETETPGVHAA